MVSLATRLSGTRLRFALALACTALSMLGAYRWYSPVPYWDMWGGALDFYLRATDGSWQAWWAQHNEHRIVLARFLFWIDYRWLDGSAAFLVVMNFVIACTGILVFRRYANESFPGPDHEPGRSLTLLAAALLMLWTQQENFTWAFQSQFFLAQLLPLSALYALYRSTVSPGGAGWFATACLLGIAACGSMANGLATLPILTAFALVTGHSRHRIAALAALSALAAWIYLRGYETPSHHGSLLATALNDPVGLAGYVLRYLGSPLYFMLGGREAARLPAQVAGFVFVFGTAFAGFRLLPKARHSALAMSLLAFIGFVLATALVTGGGRLVFGADQAFASRYTTPALMGWVAWIILLTSFIRVERLRRVLPACVTIALAALLAFQVVATRHRSDVARALNERNLAGLAIAMQIADHPQVGLVYPDPRAALDIAARAADRGIPVFAGAQDLGRLPMGHVVKSSSLPDCRGELLSATPVVGDTRFLKIRGSFVDEREPSGREFGVVASDEDAVVGRVVVRSPNRGDQTQNGRRLEGYVLSEAAGRTVSVIPHSAGCRLRIALPRPPFSVKSFHGDIGDVSLGESAVIASANWQGTDFQRSRIPGLRVLGSYSRSDVDTGSITLSVRPGESFLYRSGPGGVHQWLVFGDADTRVPLPATTDWVVIELPPARIGAPRHLTIHDDGTSWGEWSAIAVRSDR